MGWESRFQSSSFEKLQTLYQRAALVDLRLGLGKSFDICQSTKSICVWSIEKQCEFLHLDFHLDPRIYLLVFS